MLILDTQAHVSLDAAKVRLAAPPRRQGLGQALLAAGLAAATAVALAGAVILGPPPAGHVSPAVLFGL
jgi:predicted N-acetyltransferase YhbS